MAKTPEPSSEPPVPPSVDPRDALIAELRSQVAAMRVPQYAPMIASPTACDLESYTDKEWKRSSDGVRFKLKILKPHAEECNFGRTHILKNKTNFVELTKDEFKLQFEKP